MRTTLNLNKDILAEAAEATGIEEKTALIHAGLQALITQCARRRLVALGGSDKKSKIPRRRKSV